jgi:hypothetical protein
MNNAAAQEGLAVVNYSGLAGSHGHGWLFKMQRKSVVALTNLGSLRNSSRPNLR